MPSCARQRHGVRESGDVGVDDLDGVVAVAEPVPGWDLGLDVSGRVGGSGAERVAADVVGLPVKRPVLPVVWARGWIELRGVPFAFAGEADLDPGHGPGPRPGLAAHR